MWIKLLSFSFFKMVLRLSKLAVAHGPREPAAWVALDRKTSQPLSSNPFLGFFPGWAFHLSRYGKPSEKVETTPWEILDPLANCPWLKGQPPHPSFLPLSPCWSSSSSASAVLSTRSLSQAPPDSKKPPRQAAVSKSRARVREREGDRIGTLSPAIGKRSGYLRLR